MMKNNTARNSKTLKIVGHRGGGALAPENTIAAIMKGLEYRVDELEVDVRVTKDKIVIVHHDAAIKDPTTARYPIRHYSYAELKQHKPDLATLEEVIEAIARKVPLQIEVKGGEPIVPIIKVIQIFLTKGWLETDFLLGSKKQRTLLELHRALPSIPTVVIEAYSGVRATFRAQQLGTKRLSMRSWWLWRGFIRPMSRRGYLLYAYTLNDQAKARKWASYGLAGVITDNPEKYL